MKGFLTVAGTVVVGTSTLSGKERLNLQQVAIVTPRTADAMGLSYKALWEALTAESKVEIRSGSPIMVRIVSADQKAPPQVVGLAANLPLEKAAVVVERNLFIRS